MTETKSSEKKPIHDEQIARILEAGNAGIATAMRAFEQAERIYYGAVAATSTSEAVTISGNTHPRSLTPESR